MANKSTTAKKNTTTSKPKTKAASAAKPKAAPSRSPANPPAPPAPPIRREVAGAVFLVLALFVIISFFNDEGLFIRAFSQYMCGLIGWGYYLTAPIFLLTAGILFFHKGRPVMFRTVSALLLPILLSTLISFGHMPEGNTELGELVAMLFAQGKELASGGVIGGLIAVGLYRIITPYGAIPLLLGLFVFFLIKAVDFDVAAAWKKAKERASVPYMSVEDEAPSKAQPAPKTTAQPRRPAAAPAEPARAPRARRVSYDIPLGDDEEALIPNTFADIPTEDKPRVKVRKKPTPKIETFDMPEEKPQRPAERLESVDVGEGWREYTGGKKGKTQGVPVTAEISDPPKQKMKKEEIDREVDSITRSISAKADAEDEYIFPPTELLNAPGASAADSKDEIIINRDRLVSAIHSFGINAEVVGVIRGPTVTRYDFELAEGVKLARVTNLAGDLALALGVVNVRIAPIQDKISTVGIEVPNKNVSMVYLRSIIESNAFRSAKSRLSFAVGKDIGGECIVGNIAKLPHMLIAGTTGSGKSVCMNSLILSLLFKARPDEVKLIMIDPKMVELGIYSGIPHMLVPVVTDPKKAAGALQWSVVEMLKRYRTFADAGVRDIEGYNKYAAANDLDKLPQVVIVIDELADLMMIAAKEVEESICRVAQMGRAAGMHLVVATQRPSADVITGLMKANIPSRIAFAVSSAMESRIIMDASGAEKLIGMGDMLYSPMSCGKPTRIQGAFVSDEERERVIQFIKDNSSVQVEQNAEIAQYMDKALESKDSGKEKSSSDDAGAAGDFDEMLPQAVEAILETGQCSVSMLQRRVKLGYSRAARIVDQMEELGIVGPYQGAKPRDVLVDRSGWHEIQVSMGWASDDDLSLAAEMNEYEEDED